MRDVVITGLGPLYTLAEVKSQLNVDHDEDDLLIGTYMDASQAAVLKYCNIDLAPFGADAVFKVAAMMQVAALYENREGAGGLSAAITLLLDPYRWLRF